MEEADCTLALLWGCDHSRRTVNRHSNCWGSGGQRLLPSIVLCSILQLRLLGVGALAHHSQARLLLQALKASFAVVQPCTVEPGARASFLPSGQPGFPGMDSPAEWLRREPVLVS